MEKEIVKLSVIVPCFNEEKTLEKCIERVLEIEDETLSLEIIIVDDCSTDQSYSIAQKLENKYHEIVILKHEKNSGKGAALRTGFQKATGDFVCVQDADLEYNPMELRKLLVPLINNKADVVIGSRFLSTGAHRVIYFWHTLGNRFLTFLSNMFTDLNLTDMESCYKVFRREVIQSIEIEENRFGFEPEIVAKVANRRLRIFEMGISYYGRTYEEGKKIGVRDGIRALYCIFRYNAHVAPVPIQFMFYVFIGGISAIANLFIFLGLLNCGLSFTVAVTLAFFLAAIMNYVLCILLLFKRKARWNSTMELLLFFLVVCLVASADIVVTKLFLASGMSLGASKALSSGICLFFNFVGRRYLVFAEPPSGSWKCEEDI